MRMCSQSTYRVKKNNRYNFFYIFFLYIFLLLLFCCCWWYFDNLQLFNGRIHSWNNNQGLPWLCFGKKLRDGPVTTLKLIDRAKDARPDHPWYQKYHFNHVLILPSFYSLDTGDYIQQLQQRQQRQQQRQRQQRRQWQRQRSIIPIRNRPDQKNNIKTVLVYIYKHWIKTSLYFGFSWGVTVELMRHL